ncbi:PucR family transcriptional regulator [Mycetocola spongiae]|uniref:PucR family transcriptional regulator n=1 Tax=Mycetocola spongiae TaxID=2859226 RepID=UPI001CF147E7|nr:PucR family transcriptional regulator [Mycetocola spongiae]UCR89195.1 PucR family transcriptional regulator [Mycetocola spongiae]
MSHKSAGYVGETARPTGVALGRLLAADELGLGVLAGPADPGAIILTHCAVIELEHPETYLTGHELLLITGLGLSAEPGRLDAYVDALCAAGISALGFGVEPVYPEVPEALIAACERAGLVLLRVPREVPFVQITAQFARELESVRVRGLQFVSTLARRLTRAVLQPHPDRALIEALAEQSGARVLLRSGSDTSTAGVLARALPPAEEEALLSGAVAELARSERGEDLFTAPAGGALEAVARRIDRDGGRASRGTVLLLIKEHIGSDDRTGFALAADLLQAALGLPRSQTIALDQLMMLLLVDGPPADRAGIERWGRLVATSLGRAGTRAVHTVVAVSAAGEPAQATDLIWWRRALDTPFVDHRAGALRALVAAVPGEHVLADLHARGWLACVSTAYPVDELATAIREAELLLPRAREAGRPLVAGSELETLGALIPAPLSDLFARTVLEALLADPAATELVDTLYTWLLHNGSWDATARALGVHRNTVRRLVPRAGALLDRDLDDAHVRADLIFALRHHIRDGGARARTRGA